MTRVCLVGEDEVNLRYELLSHETARNALVTYDLQEPFANTVAVDTVSLGAAVSLLNDLNWYLIRYVADAIVKEPSVSETEWLSRDLALAVRDDELEAAETGRFLKVYGVVEPERERPFEDSDVEPASADRSDDDERDASPPATSDDPPELVEPMFVTRTGQTIPEYDLQEVDDTLRVRVTEAEFGA